MADIDGLKRRIELIDLRLKTAHSARERESAALVETWNQIRDRFQSQNAEIVSLRERIRVLEDTKDDLQGMVDSLLGAVEGGLERMSDETVANVREMANQLLNASEPPPVSAPEAPVAAFEPAVPRFDDSEPDISERDEFEPAYSEEAEDFDGEDETEADDFLTALERSTEAAANRELAGKPDNVEVLELDTPIDAPVSPGIRDLIARIESSSGTFAADGSDDHTNDDPETQESSEELEQDLLEIEQLRTELLGLRKRISGSGI